MTDPVVMAVSRTLARIMAERDPSRTWVPAPVTDEKTPAAPAASELPVESSKEAA